MKPTKADIQEYSKKLDARYKRGDVLKECAAGLPLAERRVFQHKRTTVEERVYSDGKRFAVVWARDGMFTMETAGNANLLVHSVGAPAEVLRELVRREYDKYWGLL